MTDSCGPALENVGADVSIVNVGSGESISVTEIASRLARVLGKAEIEPRVTGNYRVGDIRHCFADMSRAREALGFEARVSLEDGMTELGGWLENQVATDRAEDAAEELAQRGLTL